jgi:hypothetical protein
MKTLWPSKTTPSTAIVVYDVIEIMIIAQTNGGKGRKMDRNFPMPTKE